MKGVAKRILEKLGYRLTKIPKSNKGTSSLTTYEMAIIALLSHQETIRIAQVGANDGVLNDPLFNVVRKFASRTEVLLIEPQPALIPHLERNYAFHPAHHVHNGAIGPGDDLTLFTIRQEVWRDIQAPYAAGWPEYRAPTGVTSIYRDHVRRWLSLHYRGGRPIDDIIEEVVVPSSRLPDLLSAASMGPKIDVLQVDAEGFDDQVIYNCDIDATQPRLINFEAASLSLDAYGNLEKYLGERGYVVSRQDKDNLAVLSYLRDKPQTATH
jgi:FkbM family methyltransferase